MSKKESRMKTVGRKIYDVLDYVMRLVILNLLIVIPAFLPTILYSHFISEENPTMWIVYITLLPAMVYFFPAVVATCDVIRMYEDDLTKGIFKEYFRSFKKHFVKSLLYSILLFIIICLFTFQIDLASGNSVYGPLLFFYHNLTSDLIYLFGFILTIAILLVVILLFIHLPLVMIYFEGLSFWQYLKLSIMMAFKKLGLTIIMLLIVCGIGFLDIWYYFVMFLGGVSVPIYIIVKISFKQYIKIYRKVGEKDEKSV